MDDTELTNLTKELSDIIQKIHKKLAISIRYIKEPEGTFYVLDIIYNLSENLGMSLFDPYYIGNKEDKLKIVSKNLVDSLCIENNAFLLETVQTFENMLKNP